MLNKLSTQAGILFFLGISIVIGVHQGLGYVEGSDRLPEFAEAEAIKSTALIGAGLSTDVLYRKAFSVWKKMSRYQQRFDDHKITMSGYAVLDLKYRVLTHSNPQQHPTMQEMDIPEMGTHWDARTIRVVQNIEHPSDGRVIGYIMLSFDASSIDAELSKLRKEAGTSLFLALCIAVLLSFAMARRVSQPLRQLTLMSNDLGTGQVDISCFSNKLKEIKRLAESLYRADQSIFEKTATIISKDAKVSRLAAVIEQAEEIVVITNAEGVIEYVNPAFERISGYAIDEVTGQTPQILKSGQHTDKYYAAMWKTLRSGKTWRGDFINRSKSGDFYEVDQSITPILDDNGEITGFSSVQRDVTAQRKMQSRFEHFDRVESLGILAGGIAHDFNNLLTAILGNSALAKKKLEESSPVFSHLKAIEGASHSAADLCKQMLAYSGKGKFVVKAIDLSTLVENMSKLIEVSLAKNVVLKYYLSDQLPAVNADMAQMQQVVLNLITNASEAIEGKSGVISLATGVMQVDTDYLNGCLGDEHLEPGRYVYLEISDTGCGIEKEIQKKIFDPFFTTKFTGRGLGMSAMLGIIKGHHGGLRIYSEVGKGTSIKVAFPISSKDAEQIDQSHAVSSAWKGSGTILIVDDEETVREVASAIFEDVGFQVLTAKDGVEGVEVFRQNQENICVVLLDMTMPRMDGNACFRELRSIQSDVRVVLSSGYNEQDATNQFVGKGLAGFIQKPYPPESLIEKIKAVLDEENPSN
ncbi:MAG: response regulator [Mariprofundaceae bacterium]